MSGGAATSSVVKTPEKKALTELLSALSRMHGRAYLSLNVRQAESRALALLKLDFRSQDAADA